MSDNREILAHVESGGVVRRDAEWHAVRIAESWRSTVEGIIETGRLLLQAKEELGSGETFEQDLLPQLPFARRTAYYLMKIAGDHRLVEVHKCALLPPCWRTIAEMTRLDNVTLKHAVTAGIINPNCKKSDITRLMKTPVVVGEQPINEDCFTNFDDLIATGLKYGTIYADPPWQYGNQGTRAATDNHYDTMPIDAICALPVADVAAEQSHLHIWTTNAFLEDTLTKVIPAWGFTFKSILVWCKPQIGIGNYWRVNTEYLLLANRGGAQMSDSDDAGKARLNSWIQHDRLAHSEKPELFRSLIEKVSPGPYIELFARKSVPRWTALGNQIQRDLYSPPLRTEAA